MKRIICDRWKVMNFVLVLLSAAVIGVMNLFVYKGYCNSFCTTDLIWSTLSPLYNIAKILILICIGLLFVPGHIFKHWLLTLLPLFCLVMYMRLSTISINEYGGILQWSRPGMAEFGTEVFAGVTIIFVIGHMVYDYRKNKTSRSV